MVNTTSPLWIEYVCTGNNGRSPMAEALAKEYISNQRLENKIEVGSSGSGLPFTPATDEALRRDRLTLINFGIERDLFTGRLYQKAVSVLQAQVRASMEDIETCVHFIIHAETTYRNAALIEIGLMPPERCHKPTTTHIHQPHLILPMTQQNESQVARIYQMGRIALPRIVPIMQYVGEQGEIPNPFCGQLEDYQQTRDTLMRVVPMSIDKAVREYAQ